MGEKKLSKEETASLEEAIKTLQLQQNKDEEITEGVIVSPTHTILDRLMKYIMKHW